MAGVKPVKYWCMNEECDATRTLTNKDTTTRGYPHGIFCNKCGKNYLSRKQKVKPEVVGPEEGKLF